MKSKLYILLSLCVTILFAACNKTQTFDDTWKEGNEAQFAAISSNPEYTKLESQSGNGYIMYKEISQGDGATPFFTDRVKILYTGWYKNIWSKPDTYTDENGNVITNKIVFDTTGDQNNNIPRIFSVSPASIIEGLSTALQNMQVGDKWELWIPWQLGYKESGNGPIRGYTTLVFEVELLEIL